MNNPRIILCLGKDKGLEVLKFFVNKKLNPSFCFVMCEEKHETLKYYGIIGKELKKMKIEYVLTNSINSPRHFRIIKDIKPDLGVVCGWRTIIPKNALEMFSKGLVAGHESYLPKYRGFAPVNWAVRNGEKETGATLFFLDEGIDSGNIIDQKKISIGDNETSWNVYNKAKKVLINLLDKNIDSLLRGSVKGVKQDEKKATYCSALTPEDGLINWSSSSISIHNLVRATAYPYPGAFSYYEKNKVIVWSAELVSNHRNYIGKIPGKILEVIKNKGAVVATGDGTILIKDIEINGKESTADKVTRSIKGNFGSS